MGNRRGAGLAGWPPKRLRLADFALLGGRPRGLPCVPHLRGVSVAMTPASAVPYKLTTSRSTSRRPSLQPAAQQAAAQAAPSGIVRHRLSTGGLAALCSLLPPELRPRPWSGGMRGLPSPLPGGWHPSRCQSTNDSAPGRHQAAPLLAEHFPSQAQPHAVLAPGQPRRQACRGNAGSDEATCPPVGAASRFPPATGWRSALRLRTAEQQVSANR